MQNRALREYAARRGWAHTMQVKEVGSGVALRQMQETVMDAAPRPDIDVVLVWRLDRWGRSVTDLLARGGKRAGSSVNQLYGGGAAGFFASWLSIHVCLATRTSRGVAGVSRPSVRKQWIQNTSVSSGCDQFGDLSRSE